MSARDPIVTGVAEAGIAFDAGQHAIDLAAEVALRAVRDAELELDDIDAVMVTKGGDLVPGDRPANELLEHLGMSVRAVDTMLAGGSSSLSQLIHAAEAIRSGRVDRVLIVYASTQASSGLRRLGGYRRPTSNRPVQFERASGLLSPIGVAAMAAARHAHEYGTTPDQLAAVASSARAWGALNPAALRTAELTAADIAESAVIADPLRRLDCCLVTDGAGAIVVQSADTLGSRSGVELRGWAEAHSHYSALGISSLVSTTAQRTGPEAMAMAGVTHRDIGLLQIYDAFTILPIIALEDLGFAERGGAARLFAEGHTRPGGRMPMTTNGGGLSHCHPGQYGIFLAIEAVRQLRGEAGARQVEAELALCHAPGGGSFGGSTATVVMGAIDGR